MRRSAALGLGLTVTVAVPAATQPAAGQPAATVGAELSPGVAWFPHGPDTRPAFVRPLSAAEVRLGQQRAAGLRAAFLASASFSRPRDLAHLVTSSAAIEPAMSSQGPLGNVVQQTISAYWSVPRDVRRRPDGVLTPKLGGAHVILNLQMNHVPSSDLLVDRATAGEFTRGVEARKFGGYFAEPRALAQLGGGTVYADIIVITRDGSGALAPAPIGPLLDLEIERLTAIIAQSEALRADRLREAEASMTPERVAERRATRDAVWRKETPDPAVLARRLDAAHRADLDGLERTRRDVALPPSPDPQHPVWAPRLSLDAARRLAAALPPAARSLPACGHVEPGFRGSYGVRFVVVGTAPGCVPMVQVRDDLLDPGRPLDEVQLLTVPFRGSDCGEDLGGARVWSAGGSCHDGLLRLLREMDWPSARRTLGW